MRTVNILKTIILSSIFCLATLFAQPILKEEPHITKRSFNSLEHKPLKFSNKKYAILEKKLGEISELYIAYLDSSMDITKAEKKEKILSFSMEDNVKLIQFSKSGEQVVFRKSKNKKSEWEIHDIKSNKSKIIKSDEGSIRVASIYDIKNMLYSVYTDNERPRAFLIKDNKDPVFIGNGSGLIWSADRNYFLMQIFQDDNLSLFEKKKFGKITQEEFKEQIEVQGGAKREIYRRYAIFSPDGKQLLKLQDYDLVDWIQWSPDNYKIVLAERGVKGFKIIYLNFINADTIEIADIYHFQGISNSSNGPWIHCLYPKWSPDGSKILFTTEVEDGNQILYNNAYILEDHSYNYYPILETSDTFISKAEWISEKSILFDTYGKGDGQADTYELIIDEGVKSL